MTRLGRLARGVVARLPLPLTEAQFQTQVTQLAVLRGWEWAHFRPARRADGSWYVPVEGPLGKGWKDLVLVREKGHRLIFAELKTERGTLTSEQARVHELLHTALHRPVPSTDPAYGHVPSVEVYLWRPSDWDEIEQVLW